MVVLIVDEEAEEIRAWCLNEFKQIVGGNRSKKFLSEMADIFIDEDPKDGSLYGVTKKWLLENLCLSE